MTCKSLTELIECFKMLPGVGQKTAERYAYTILEKDSDKIADFSQALIDCKTKIKACLCCGNFSEQELCEICSNERRNHHLICVVQSPKDIVAMEKTNEYNGVYHVLNGCISPSKGIMPSDLTIDELMNRVDEHTEEVILAINMTIEGETTALYLDKLLKDKKCNVTRIARGLPMGAQLDYADELTLINSLEGRKRMGDNK